jgi:multiple sugar transport system permease protein
MALGSFTSAFSTFFYALIICPDEKMWTLMVWLYQLQMISNSQSINYAALCLASIPTLLVFIFCQRIIMRGIVVPTEK